MAKKRIAVLCSGGGSNFQAVIDGIKSGAIDGKICLMIATSSSAYAIERAKANGIPYRIITKKGSGGLEAAYEARHEALMQAAPDIIVLAGYLGILLPKTIAAFPQRIINIHPALLPKHGGKGMHGHFVHEAVLASGDNKSGATVHFVDEGVDSGAIILQEEVPVIEGDTPETLAARVLKTEHKILPKAVAMLCKVNLTQPNT